MLLTYAHPGTVPGPFHDSVIGTILSDRRLNNRIVGHIGITSGPRIASARNMMCQIFLDGGDADWLWMVDSDMTFDIDTLEGLLQAKQQIVGGLCFGGRGNYVFPTLYRLVNPDENNGEPIQVIEDFPLDTVVKVDATGAACLLIHRDVLTKMREVYPAPAHWFSESVYGGLEFGEDWTFCLRAQQAGFPVHVHTGVQVGHVKPRIIGMGDFIQYKALEQLLVPAEITDDPALEGILTP